MPWWFWPLAVMWSIPVLLSVAVFVWFSWLSVESRRHRRWLDQQADERLNVPRPHADVSVLDGQRSNPRGTPRADHWRI